MVTPEERELIDCLTQRDNRRIDMATIQSDGHAMYRRSHTGGIGYDGVQGKYTSPQGGESPRGQPINNTVDEWKNLAGLYAKTIERQKDMLDKNQEEINRLKLKVNQLDQNAQKGRGN